MLSATFSARRPQAARHVIPARCVEEPRFLIISKMAEKHWSAVVTRRSGRLRIISVRRALKEEAALYEG